VKTDELFYEFFELAPQALFELLGITPGCEYRFQSLVVKSAERRMDGLLEPLDPEQPRYFLEVQGYLDKSIYWRMVHQIGLFHARRPKLHGHPWQAIVLFLDETYDPGLETMGPLMHGHKHWLLHGYLPELLKRLKATSPILNVLRPLIAEQESVVRQQASGWVRAIRQSPDLDQAAQKRLVNLLVQFIVQKFSHLKSEEITKMLQLTPLRETVAVREWMHEGKVEMLAMLMEHKLSVAASKVMARLKALSETDLEALSAYLWKAENYQQVEAWIDGRLAVA